MVLIYKNECILKIFGSGGYQTKCANLYYPFLFIIMIASLSNY